MDDELERLIKEIRETCGIDPSDKDFNRHIAKTTFNYLMRRREVSEYVAVFFEVLTKLAPQLVSSSGLPNMARAGSTTVSANYVPQPSTSAIVPVNNPNPLPDLEPEIDWIWSQFEPV